MLLYILNEQKKKKNMIILSLIFSFLLIMYIVLDNYGYQSYKTLAQAFGSGVLISTLLLNILISLLSSFTISISLINFSINNRRTSGSLFAWIGNIFALIFTGCASCGLSLFAAIGLSIGLPTIMPGAVKYKFFALLLISLGLIIVLYLIQNSTCSIKKGDQHEK